MKEIGRYLLKSIQADIEEKIVMVGGPRQVGKTTLSKLFISRDEQYLNWDFLEDRAKIKKHQVNPDLKAIVLDEVHKYSRWRGLVKGLYDKYQGSLKIMVTGSARLDFFRKGGDSLFGRFFYYRLHPFSLNEVSSTIENPLERLLSFGGFPEPFLKKSKTFHRRWQRERLSRVVYQDIKDLNNLKDVGLMELLVDSLPEKVGSGLSVKSLSEDLQVSPNTVKNWLEVLGQVYYCYRISPFGSPKVRSVKKTQKLYLWDWSEVPARGSRFENMVASQLLKFCHFQEDVHGHKMELRYLKDIDNREIDFVVLKTKSLCGPWSARQERKVSLSIFPTFESEPIFLIITKYTWARGLTEREMQMCSPLLSFVRDSICLSPHFSQSSVARVSKRLPTRPRGLKGAEGELTLRRSHLREQGLVGRGFRQPQQEICEKCGLGCIRSIPLGLASPSSSME